MATDRRPFDVLRLQYTPDWGLKKMLLLGQFSVKTHDADSGWNGGAGFKLAGGFKWDVAISSGEQRKVHVDIPT